MTIEATTGEWSWPVDQVGPQALPFQITLEDGTHPDVTAWTWQVEVWTAPVDDGGVFVARGTVDGLDSSGNGVARFTAVDAKLFETGMWVELVQLSPVVFPWLRATLTVGLRVAD